MIEKIEIMKFPKLVFRPFCGKNWSFYNVLVHHLFQNLLLALVSGLIWFQLPYKEKSIEDRYSLVGYVTLVTVSYE